MRPYLLLRVPWWVVRKVTTLDVDMYKSTEGSRVTGRLLQSCDSSRRCAMCRQSLHFTDLEMYPIDVALETALDMWRGGRLADTTGSAVDASTSQVAFKLLATPGTASYTYDSMRNCVQVFQEQLQQQYNIVSQARAAPHGARTCPCLPNSFFLQSYV